MSRKDIKSRIKEYFFKNPTQKLRVREIERKVNIPLPSAIRYAKELCNEGVLQTVKVSNVVLYTPDRNSALFLLEKKLFNLMQIYDSGLIDFLKREYSNPTVVLFGSFSRGEDVEESDIDLYVETSQEIKGLERFEKKLGHKIQVFRNIKGIKNKELINNIINGITLNGFLEVFR